MECRRGRVRRVERACAEVTAKEIRDGGCPKRKDGTHCVHWWDDDGPCCGCGDGAKRHNAKMDRQRAREERARTKATTSVPAAGRGK